MSWIQGSFFETERRGSFYQFSVSWVTVNQVWHWKIVICRCIYTVLVWQNWWSGFKPWSDGVPGKSCSLDDSIHWGHGFCLGFRLCLGFWHGLSLRLRLGFWQHLSLGLGLGFGLRLCFCHCFRLWSSFGLQVWLDGEAKGSLFFTFSERSRSITTAEVNQTVSIHINGVGRKKRGSTKKEMETYGNIWKHMETYGNIWKHMETCGNHGFNILFQHLSTTRKVEIIPVRGCSHVSVVISSLGMWVPKVNHTMAPWTLTVVMSLNIDVKEIWFLRGSPLSSSPNQWKKQDIYLGNH